MKYQYISNADGRLYEVKGMWSEARSDYNLVESAGDLESWYLLTCEEYNDNNYRLYLRQKHANGTASFRIVYCPKVIYREAYPRPEEVNHETH